MPLLKNRSNVIIVIRLFQNTSNFADSINRMAFIRRHINILFVFILPVYLYIVQNSIQNEHTHVYANGMVVTHSHPVDCQEESPIKNHEHSTSEICLYSSLHFDVYNVPLNLQLLVNLNELEIEYFVIDERVPELNPHLITSPRGPPAKCFSNVIS